MEPRDRTSEDALTRVSREVANRLAALGIALSGDESTDDLRLIADAVEEFERAVEGKGGDLMVDEPPLGGRAQPDSPNFGLPLRAADESVERYVERLQRAARDVNNGPRK
jgi:hypothetical protein